MSFSFEGLPRSLDTAFFKRVKCGDGPPVVMGWIISLPRTATPAEKKWLDESGFVLNESVRSERGWPGGGDWGRRDRPDDFAQ